MAGFVCLAVVMVPVFWLHRTGGVSRGNYNQIRIGMTEAEVESILGGPGDELGLLGREDVHAEEPRELLLTHWPQKQRCWQDDTHQINVEYDASGRVVARSYTRNPEAGFVTRLLDRLGL
jgi:hypothetical protein